MITATLEVEHGIENLWKKGPGNGLRDNPDFGQFIPVHYFKHSLQDFLIFGAENSTGTLMIFLGTYFYHWFGHLMCNDAAW